MMKRASVWGWVCLVAAGCAAGTVGSGSASDRGAALEPMPSATAATGQRVASHPPSYDTLLARLPRAPWADEALAGSEAPEELVGAWRGADNRGWCAPLAPVLMEGVSARTVPLDGGWAVAFDAPGERGVMADGSTCSRCGISSYGVAGTAATAEEWAHLGPANLETSFRDGSLAEFETGEDGAATATLVAAGQDCVYQVWSFLGEDHLRDLVGGLRFVAVEGTGGGPRMAGLPAVAQ